MLFKKEPKGAILKNAVISNNLNSVLNEQSLIENSPTYLAGLTLLSAELARFSFTFKNADKFENIFKNVKATKGLINSEYEAKKYLFMSLLDTGVVAIVVFDKTYIFNSDEFVITSNKAGEYTGIQLKDKNATKISKDFVILINLSDLNKGGFRDWLKDVIELEKSLIQYISVYSKNFGLFGAYKVVGDVDERAVNLLQIILQEARKKMQKGNLPVLPSSIDIMNKEMKAEIITEAKDYIIKTIARVMQIPLLLFQAREGGAYALAKEEYKTFYYTTLQGYLELVRSAIERYIQTQYNVNATVEVDNSDIDFLSEARDWTAQEIAILINAGVVNEEEARKLLKIDFESNKQVFNVFEEKTKNTNETFETETKTDETEKQTEAKREEERKEVETVSESSSEGHTETVRRRKEQNIEEIKKQIASEDEKVWNWHDTNIRPLERKTARELLQAYNNNLRDYFNKHNKAVSSELEINVSELAKKLATAIANVLNKNGAIAVDRTIKLNSIFNNVYIDNEDLKDTLKDLTRYYNEYFESSFTEEIAKILDNIISENDGEYSIDDVVDKLEKYAFSKERAMTIARTEINKICNITNEKNAERAKQIASESGLVLKKRWSTAQDEKVRLSHQQAGLQGWIGYDETFLNNLKRPHDDNAEASEVINCRCVLLTKLFKS